MPGDQRRAAPRPDVDRRGRTGIPQVRRGRLSGAAQDLLTLPDDAEVPGSCMSRGSSRQDMDSLGRHPARLDERAPPRVNRDGAGLGPVSAPLGGCSCVAGGDPQSACAAFLSAASRREAVCVAFRNGRAPASACQHIQSPRGRRARAHPSYARRAGATHGIRAPASTGAAVAGPRAG